MAVKKGGGSEKYLNCCEVLFSDEGQETREVFIMLFSPWSSCIDIAVGRDGIRYEQVGREGAI